MRAFSLKYRIATGFFLLGLILVGLVLWRFESVSYRNLRADHIAANQACFQMLSQPSRVALINEEFSELEDYFTVALQNPQVDEIQLADHRKLVVASTEPRFLGQPLPPLEGGEYSSWQQKEIVNPSGCLGWLAVKFSTRLLHDALHRARNQSLIIALISLVVIAIVALVIGFLLTRRLEKLDAAARKIIAGDDDVELDIAGRDEVAHLSQALAGQVAKLKGQLSNLKVTEAQLNQRLREMAVISKLSDHLTLKLDFKQLVEFVMSEIILHVHSDTALFYSLDDGQLFLKGILPANERPLGDVHQIGICLCGLAAEGEVVHSLDIRKDPRCTLNECKEAGIRSFAALPFKVGNEILGVLGVASKTIYDYGTQADFLETFAATAAIGWQNIELYQKVSESVKERELQIEKLESAEKALSKAHFELEERVAQRTAELEKTRQALLNLLEDINLSKEELEAANEKLKELDRLKSMFIASMSHELRTPLNSVIGFSAILKDEWLGPLNDEQKVNLETILRSGKHLLSLINDVIDISKIEAGTIEPEFTEFDLDEVLQEAVSSLINEAEGKGLVLNLESLSQVILCDRRRLMQVVLNLLSNAIKFTKQGSVFVEARLLADQEKIEIRVTDTGIGISYEDMGKLFKPFSRLHDASQSEYPGTGLGLYLCQKIAGDIFDGTIKVESIVGRGSVFYVTIPMRVKR